MAGRKSTEVDAEGFQMVVRRKHFKNKNKGGARNRDNAPYDQSPPDSYLDYVEFLVQPMMEVMMEVISVF